MKKIANIVLSKLRNNEHFQFMADFLALLGIVTPVAINSEEEAANFNEAFAKLDEELRVDKGSIFTQPLQESDQRRDNTWRAIDARVKATLLCPIEEEVAAATRLKRIIDLYGDVRKLSYNEETGALTNLTGDLQNRENGADVTLLGLSNWVAALSNENTTFKDLQNQRDTEAAFKNSGNVKEARLHIDPIYELIVERVNAMVSLNMTTPEIENFITELNQKIENIEITIATREGRRIDSTVADDETAPEDV